MNRPQRFSGLVRSLDLLVLVDAEEDRGDHDRHDDGQRDIDVDVVPRRDRQLDANEQQDAAERMREIVETFASVGQQEVHGSKAHDGERVCGQDRKWIIGDTKRRWNRVDRKNHVGCFDNNQGSKQRGGSAHAVLAGEELLSVVLFRHRHDSTE